MAIPSVPRYAGVCSGIQVHPGTPGIPHICWYTRVQANRRAQAPHTPTLVWGGAPSHLVGGPPHTHPCEKEPPTCPKTARCPTKIVGKQRETYKNNRITRTLGRPRHVLSRRRWRIPRHTRIYPTKPCILRKASGDRAMLGRSRQRGPLPPRLPTHRPPFYPQDLGEGLPGSRPPALLWSVPSPAVRSLPGGGAAAPRRAASPRPGPGGSMLYD